mmetsp:Transcript_23416/g.63490  ORF Transcript_23416/g.63490 Transcript_23416/m.63490 type:complete len:336 (-) Transcript_23416:173-1180(-)
MLVRRGAAATALTHEQLTRLQAIAIAAAERDWDAASLGSRAASGSRSPPASSAFSRGGSRTSKDHGVGGSQRAPMIAAPSSKRRESRATFAKVVGIPGRSAAVAGGKTGASNVDAGSPGSSDDDVDSLLAEVDAHEPVIKQVQAATHLGEHAYPPATPPSHKAQGRGRHPPAARAEHSPSPDEVEDAHTEYASPGSKRRESKAYFEAAIGVPGRVSGAEGGDNLSTAADDAGSPRVAARPNPMSSVKSGSSAVRRAQPGGGPKSPSKMKQGRVEVVHPNANRRSSRLFAEAIGVPGTRVGGVREGEDVDSSVEASSGGASSPAITPPSHRHRAVG